MYFMKKVLLVLNEAPLPNRSAAGKWYYYFINNMRIRNDISLVVLGACAEVKHLEEAQKIFPQDFFFLYPKRSGLFSKIETIARPFSYMFSNEMQLKFQELSTQSFDIIHLEQIWSLWLVNKPLKNALVSVHYLNNIDQKNFEHKKMKDKFLSMMQKRTERKLINRVSTIKTCSEQIKTEIKKWFPNKKYFSIPFIIDSKIIASKRVEANNNKSVVLIGSMDWPPSFLAAKRVMLELWPSILKAVPEAKLVIVGWNAKKNLEVLKKDNSIEIFENVADIAPYFLNNSIMLYPPTVGSGNKIKLQEAILYKLPIITTESGIEGLETLKDRSIIVKDSNIELIKETISLLNDPLKREKLAESALSQYLEEYSISKIINHTLEMYDSM